MYAKLYNNIVIDESAVSLPDGAEESFEEIPVPYLENPPEVINISTGRQLFVDDFLIEQTSLNRVEHRPELYENNPVFFPEKPWETGEPEREWEQPGIPMAAPFSGGVWYDGEEKIYKMWYTARFHGNIAYAESRDGVHFERICTDIYENTNIVIPRGGGFLDTSAVTLNNYSGSFMHKYVMSLYVRPVRNERVGVNIMTSEDGIHWTLAAHSAGVDDTTTLFYNPFRRKWVYSIKKNCSDLGRRREYADSDDPIKGRMLENRRFWLRCDCHDIPEPEWQLRPELYSFNSVAYESLMVGAFTIFKGPQNEVSMQRGLPKITELHIGFSRDGFHYSRQKDRTAFLAPSKDKKRWDCGYLHSNAAIFTIKNDRMFFYYAASKGDESRKQNPNEDQNGMYAGGAMGMASIRRDGFASLNGRGEFITRKLQFDGEYLFVNANSKNLRVAVLDEDCKEIPGFKTGESIAFNEDSCMAGMCWIKNSDLKSLRGRVIRLKFTQESGAIYAFWISRAPNGASGGYLAGGEHGKRTAADTV